MVVLDQVTWNAHFDALIWGSSYTPAHPQVFQAIVWDEIIISHQGKYQFGNLTLRRKCTTAQFSRKSENRLALVQRN